MGYFRPKHGLRIRFYSFENVECPSDVTLWRKLAHIKTFKFTGETSRKAYHLGSAYGQRSPILLKSVSCTTTTTTPTTTTTTTKTTTTMITSECPAHIGLYGAPVDNNLWVYNGMFVQKWPYEWHHQTKNRRGQTIQIFIAREATRIGRLRARKRSIYKL